MIRQKRKERKKKKSLVDEIYVTICTTGHKPHIDHW